MAEDHDVEKLEEQQDLFTVVIAVFFITIVAALGHGFFAMADRSTGTVGTVVPRVVALYVFPGLMCGYAYGMWGILVGAIVGGVVRMLSLINLGFIIPYFEITEEKHVYMQFSFDKALGATSPLLLWLVVSVVAGAVLAAVGWGLTSPTVSKKRVLRLLRRAAAGFLVVAFVLAGGVWLYGFLPFGESKTLQDKLARIEEFVGTWDLYVIILLWIGLALTVLTLGLAAVGRRKSSAEKDVGAIT